MTDRNGTTPEAITLTLHNRAADEYGVCWMCLEAGTPVLEYTDVEDEAFVCAKRIYANVEEYGGRVRNTAVIKDAVAGEKYLWRVGDESGVWSEPAVFTALDARAEELCFLVFTDSQDEENDGKLWPAAWRDALERHKNAALTVHAGDVVQCGEDAELWRAMCENNESLFRTLPMLAITGNHDYWCERTHIIYNHFNLDVPRERSALGVYYSADVGCVHFTMLSSGDCVETDGHGLRREQIEWARRDIEGSSARWKVVLIHTPLYSPGKYGSRKSLMSNPDCLREQFNETFADLGVDLVISGHDHIFSETYPIKADGTPERECDYVIKKHQGEYYRFAVSPAGPIHVIPGCCGNQNRCIEDEMDASFARYFKDIIDMPKGCVSYAAITADSKTLAIDFAINRAEDGSEVIRRRFGIQKT